MTVLENLAELFQKSSMGCMIPTAALSFSGRVGWWGSYGVRTVVQFIFQQIIPPELWEYNFGCIYQEIPVPFQMTVPYEFQVWIVA